MVRIHYYPRFMKIYKVRYLNEKMEEKTTEIEGHSNFNARLAFMRKYAGKFSSIISILSLGKIVKHS